MRVRTLMEGGWEMASTYETGEADPDFEIWATLTWVIGQWICDQGDLDEDGRLRDHIRFPGPYNGACDSCYETAHNLVYVGLRQLLKVHGAVTYSCARDNLPEGKATRRALEAMLARARVL
jgi:hypothetical protein